MSENIKTIHEKAIRLVEGGVVEVSGLSVRLVKDSNIFDPCFTCEMDCLCHFGNDMHLLCRECDIITKKNCFLILVSTN